MTRAALVLCLAFAVPAHAQIIHGTVSEAGTGTLLKAVDVRLFTTKDAHAIYGVTSDADGEFELIVPAGKAVYIRAEGLGYQTAISSPLTAHTGEQIEIDVHMSPEAIPVEGVDVVARKPVDWRLRPFLDRAAINKKAGFGHIWMRADIERANFPLLSQLLRTIPSRDDPMCMGTSIYIDNLPVAEDDLDMLITPEDLEGVEMYRTNEMPTDWANRTLVISNNGLLEIDSEARKPCMLILLWRKPYNAGGEPMSFARVARTLAFVAGVILLNRIEW